MEKRTELLTAFRVAYPKTLPIFAGFVFLGIAYGFMMNSLGFSAIYPILISLIVFAGSVEFVAASLLIGAFNPLTALFLTLTVNARHLFYGLSMLGKYDGVGKKKGYMVLDFAMNHLLLIVRSMYQKMLIKVGLCFLSHCLIIFIGY